MSILLEETLELCREYSALGWAVQEQFKTVLETNGYKDYLDSAYEEGKLNLNAVKYIIGFLDNYSDIIEDATKLVEKLNNWMRGFNE